MNVASNKHRVPLVKVLGDLAWLYLYRGAAAPHAEGAEYLSPHRRVVQSTTLRLRGGAWALAQFVRAAVGDVARFPLTVPVDLRTNKLILEPERQFPVASSGPFQLFISGAGGSIAIYSSRIELTQGSRIAGNGTLLQITAHVESHEEWQLFKALFKNTRRETMPAEAAEAVATSRLDDDASLIIRSNNPFPGQPLPPAIRITAERLEQRHPNVGRPGLRTVACVSSCSDYEAPGSACLSLRNEDVFGILKTGETVHNEVQSSPLLIWPGSGSISFPSTCHLALSWYDEDSAQLTDELADPRFARLGEFTCKLCLACGTESQDIELIFQEGRLRNARLDLEPAPADAMQPPFLPLVCTAGQRRAATLWREHARRNKMPLATVQGYSEDADTDAALTVVRAWWEMQSRDDDGNEGVPFRLGRVFGYEPGDNVEILHEHNVFDEEILTPGIVAPPRHLVFCDLNFGFRGGTEKLSREALAEVSTQEELRDRLRFTDWGRALLEWSAFDSLPRAANRRYDGLIFMDLARTLPVSPVNMRGGTTGGDLWDVLRHASLPRPGKQRKDGVERSFLLRDRVVVVVSAQLLRASGRGSAIAFRGNMPRKIA